MTTQTKRNAAWIFRWHAERVFEAEGDCFTMWWYLLHAEVLDNGDEP
jgi:hypothetical protein